mmetsp:Transcript_90624/g.233934  ORF Transcript_90624/g.233934 Transcript_90624/m.233934 type:complete len:580 (+) Transcript_90624:154-1893(+)
MEGLSAGGASVASSAAQPATQQTQTESADAHPMAVRPTLRRRISFENNYGAVIEESGKATDVAEKVRRTSTDVEEAVLQPQLRKVNSTRAATVLQRFTFYEELEPHVQKELCRHVILGKYPADTVLFRQGDPPGNCYVVLSGEVGVFAMTEDELVQQRRMAKSGAHGTSAALAELRASFAEEPPSPGAASVEEILVGSSLFPTEPMASTGFSDNGFRGTAGRRSDIPTAEAFSTYHPDADFGKRVAVLGPGSIFGELELLTGHPRNATVRLLETSEFLIIRKTDFSGVLKDEMKLARDQKQAFLTEHVPGMRGANHVKGRPHSAYYFQKAIAPVGHTFIKQGDVAEESIFVVLQGSVEFVRTESAVPWARGPNTSHPRKAMGTRFMVQDPATDLPGQTVFKLGSLVTGGVFTSCPVAGAPEPFTVSAASRGTEVFHVSSGAFAKLPRAIIDATREHMMKATQWRLESLRQRRALEPNEDSAPPPPTKNPLHKSPSAPAASLRHMGAASPAQTGAVAAMLQRPRMGGLGGRQMPAGLRKTQSDFRETASIILHAGKPEVPSNQRASATGKSGRKLPALVN